MRLFYHKSTCNKTVLVSFLGRRILVLLGMKKKEVSFIFGKTLTTHLASMPTNSRYLTLRIERFSEEFLNADVTFENVDTMLDAIYDYMYQCEESSELEHHLINLKQSIFWLRAYSEL